MNRYIARSKPGFFFSICQLALMSTGALAVEPFEYCHIAHVMNTAPFAHHLTGQHNSSQASFSAGGAVIPFNNAVFLPQLGTFPLQTQSLQLQGHFSLPTPTNDTAKTEDEGSIPLATPVILTSGTAVTLSGVIGDGSFGSSGTESGDVDYYEIANVLAGQEIFVDINTNFTGLTSTVEIRSSNGDLLLTQQPVGFSPDPLVEFIAPADGTYYVSVAGFGVGGLQDPFDSASGPGDTFPFDGGLSEGNYDIVIGLDYVETRDVFVLARLGDVFGAAIDVEQVKLTLTDPNQQARMISQQDFSFIFPPTTPLPAGISAVQHVTDTFGIYKLEIRARQSGAFKLDLVSKIPPSRQQAAGTVQTLFLDFDGATVDLAEVVPFGPPGVVSLSPLSAFLTNWGLRASDEDAVIDKIISTVKDNLVNDIMNSNTNPAYDLQVLNSRDHADVFGQPNVSRVIIGGSSDEIGFPAIGLAQSIDPGNFATEETALVILDVLGGVNPFIPISINDIPLAPQALKTDLVGETLGEIASHEAGHLYGNFHTETLNGIANLMDDGSGSGLLDVLVGIGPDMLYGTADDIDVGLGVDVFSVIESFEGVENTLSTVAWGVSPPRFIDLILNNQ